MVVRKMLSLTLEWSIMVKNERKLEIENWSFFLGAGDPRAIEDRKPMKNMFQSWSEL
jgi:hypothetical protein